MHLSQTLDITYIQRHYSQKPVDFSSLLRPLCTVSHLDELVYIFHHLPLFTDTTLVTDINIFKTPIKPLWEDTRNISGGKYIIKLKRAVGQRLFERLVMSFATFDDNINGIVASIRTSQVILSVWCDTTQNNLDFVKRVRKMLNVEYEIPIEYKDNDESLKDNSSFRNTSVFGKIDARDNSDMEAKLENLSTETKGQKIKETLLDNTDETKTFEKPDNTFEHDNIANNMNFTTNTKELHGDEIDAKNTNDIDNNSDSVVKDCIVKNNKEEIYDNTQNTKFKNNISEKDKSNLNFDSNGNMKDKNETYKLDTQFKNKICSETQNNKQSKKGRNEGKGKNEKNNIKDNKCQELTNYKKKDKSGATVELNDNKV